MAKSVYAQAGVDFELEHGVVNILKALREATLPFTADLRQIGITFPEEGQDFSGGFQVDVNKLRDNGIHNFSVHQCVDGPGSKPVVHALYEGDDEIKQSCTTICSVAMVANDLICSGARPVTLTEDHSWHTPNEEIAKQMARGNYIGAQLSRSTIIGGENASLPQMVTGPNLIKAYDMCHMATGLVLDDLILTNPLGPRRVKAGDKIIGLSSSGPHCNGITLLWKTAIGYDEHGFDEAARINETLKALKGESPAEAILTPTTIYVEPILAVLNAYEDEVKAIANITGEGIHNLERVLPESTGAFLDYKKRNVQRPQPVFKWVQKEADIPEREMYEDYNMGTGMMLVVSKESSKSLIEMLNTIGSGSEYPHQRFRAYDLGEIREADKKSICITTASGKQEEYK